MQLAAVFDNDFKPRYQRNNKKSGQKNLRCFPQCSESKHVKTGFCGRSIQVTISNIKMVSRNAVVRAFGEIVECGAADRFNANEVVPAQVMESAVRVRDGALNQYLRGEVSVNQNDEESVDITFNRQLLGWHYGWKSSKHTCDALHCFRVSIFQQEPYLEDAPLTYYGYACSPGFQIYSRRRQRGMVDPAAASSVGINKPGKRPAGPISFGGDDGDDDDDDQQQQQQQQQQPIDQALAPPPGKRVKTVPARQQQQQQQSPLDGPDPLAISTSDHQVAASS